MTMLAVDTFSTDAFAPADRHEAWRSRDWPTIGPAFETRPAGAFFNRADRFVLGSVTVHVSDMGGQTYRRTAAQARRDAFDPMIVSIPIHGCMTGEAAGRGLRNRRGMLAVADLAQDHVHRSSDSRTIMLTVPRSVAAAAALDPGALHGAVAIGAGVDILREHVVAIHARARSIAAADGAALGETVLALLRLALGRATPPRLDPRPAEAALLVRARHAIDTALADPALDATRLCRELHVSRSVLYRAFEPLGGVARFIRDRRLDAARRTLAADPGTPIGAVAERSGFGDAAHFSRAYRTRFGEAPRDTRAGRIDK